MVGSDLTEKILKSLYFYILKKMVKTKINKNNFEVTQNNETF